jgi:16S rRNA (cytidine1402-2'-O)-methyltransferase
MASKMKKGKLYLIPSVIAEDTQGEVIGNHIRSVLPQICHFLAEDLRTARRYLSSLKIYESIEPLQFALLNKDSGLEVLTTFSEWIDAGHSVGVLSDAGCPGVADPGAIAVDYAHRHNIKVVPLVGPSSILMALMASGLNGQRFAFHGYLPIDARELSQAIKNLERESRAKNQTQILIETPYRNNSVVKALLQGLHENTRLTIAMDITGTNEFIATHPIAEWRKIKKEFLKAPAVYLFLAS